MSSAVYYKFKSQRNESRIAIDGTGISVFDLKREIIQANDLGKAMDIDLQVFEPKGEQGPLHRLSLLNPARPYRQTLQSTRMTTLYRDPRPSSSSACRSCVGQSQSSRNISQGHPNQQPPRLMGIGVNHRLLLRGLDAGTVGSASGLMGRTNLKRL